MDINKKNVLLLIFIVLCGINYAQTNQNVIVKVANNSKTASLYNQGVNLFITGKKTEALAKFDACIDKDKSFYKSFLAKGYLLLLDAHYQESLDYFYTYKKNSKEKAIVNECIAEAHYGLEDYMSAIASIDEAIKEEPNNIRLLRKKVTFLISTTRYNEAIQNLNTAIAKNTSQNDILLEERAAVKILIKDFNGAIADYNTLIKKNPNQAAYYTNRGIANEHLKNNKEAIADFDNAIALDSNNLENYNHRAVVYIDEEKYDDAKKDLNYVISKEPKNAIAYNNLGIVYFKENRIVEAIDFYDKAIQYKNDYGQAYYNRGISKNYIDKESAKEDLNKAISYGIIEAARFLHTF